MSNGDYNMQSVVTASVFQTTLVRACGNLELGCDPKPLNAISKSLLVKYNLIDASIYSCRAWMVCLPVAAAPDLNLQFAIIMP